jgi:MYXO-CTERM domain-containing protein
MSRVRARVSVVLGACCSLFAGNAPGGRAATTAPQVVPAAARARVNARRGMLPLRFEANAGQWDPRVRFATHRGGATLFITDDGMTFGLRDGGPVTMKLVGARPAAARGEHDLSTKSNFFLGNDPSAWRTGVSNYGQVRASGWLPGVDVVWHGGERGLEYDLEVAAGVDARAVELEIDGADRLETAKDGSLDVVTQAGTLVQRPPRVIQGDRELAASYVRAGERRFRFAIEGYDPKLPLLIDPPLAYSSYLGGSGSEGGGAIAVDASGDVYLAGGTDSLDFPTKGPLQPKNAGGFGEVFLTKLNAAGTALVYSTYLGGSGAEDAAGIALDSSGNVYLTGSTHSTDFPTQGPIQATHASDGGYTDAFVAKIDASGSTLVYSTYLGGGDADYGHAIAVDASGNAYVTGNAWSTDFPTYSALQPTFGGGSDDAFVAKLNPSGSAFVYCTYLGGSDIDFGTGIAADASGDAYVAGGTDSATDFPTKNSIQAGHTDNAFVTKLSPDGSALVYSTFVGGTGANTANGIAIDSSGDAYIAGYTSSTDFPTTQGAFQTTYGGANFDAFVSEVNAAGSALVYSTFLGASGDDRAYGIAVDPSGNAYVIGTTGSEVNPGVDDFPTQDAPQGTFGKGFFDAFVSAVAAGGSSLLYSTYLGGDQWDDGAAIAVDADGNAYATGDTFSLNFPEQGGVQATHASDQGATDAFVTKIGDSANGAPCTDGSQCSSLICVDGTCCDSACTDQCAACDVAGQEGTCSPVTGAPHGSRAACGGAGVCAAACDGVDTTQCGPYPGAGTSCGSTCSAGVQTDDTCDGNGGCVAGATHSCNDFACTPDGTQCNTTCAVDADCAAGFTCSGGACVPSAACVDDHTANTSGSPQDCTPYVCQNGCKTSCATSADCVAGNVCTGNACVPATSSGGCSCSAADDGSAPWQTGLLAVVCASLLGRKRRSAVR